MRISDWSSDVCSSDLVSGRGRQSQSPSFCPPEWAVGNFMGGEPSVGETKGRSHRPVSRDRRRSEIGSAIHLLWVQRRDRTDAQTAPALRKRYVISLSYLARPLPFPFPERSAERR